MRLHLAILLGLAHLSACRSPVLSDERDALGPELPDVERGEFHRPGQPCLRCHDSRGGQDPEMVVAGTVFATPEGRVPFANAAVTIEDGLGELVTTSTNCVGNFYITKEDWPDAVFPLRPSVACVGPGVAGGGTMDSLVYRDGACAGCHTGSAGEESAGWVYCFEQQPNPPIELDPSCPGRIP